MKKTAFSLLFVVVIAIANSLQAQTFEEYLALFQPIKQDYGFAGNSLEEMTKQKKPISANFRSFIDTKTDTLTAYYPVCVFGDNTYYVVLLVCKNKEQPELLSLISRLYDSKGNRKPTRLDINKKEDFLAYVGKDEENRYSFFTQYNAKHYRFSIWYEKVSEERNSFPSRGIFRAYTLSADGYTRYSPTTDLDYDPYTNTTPYAPPANAVTIDYKKDKKIQLQEDKKIQLQVGQILYFSAPVHGSVGTGANIQSTQEQILQYFDGHNCYKKVQLRGETGGDGASYTVIFKAVKAGKCNLVYKKTFRGKVEKIYKIKVRVID